MFKLTEKAKRVKKAIKETESVLKQQTAYSIDLQNKALIDEYRNHLVRLQGMLLNEILA
jgi:hypothetical protein